MTAPKRHRKRRTLNPQPLPGFSPRLWFAQIRSLRLSHIWQFPKYFMARIRRSQRKGTFNIYLILYPLIAIALSVGLSFWVYFATSSPPATKDESAKTTATSSPDLTLPLYGIGLNSSEIRLGTSVSVGDVMQSRQISAKDTAETAKRQYELANMEFLAGHYAEAEKLYQKVLPYVVSKDQVVFQIYCSFLAQDKLTEAAIIMRQIKHAEGGSKSKPLLYYARAARAFKNQKDTEALALIKQVRIDYPQAAPIFEPALQRLGYLK